MVVEGELDILFFSDDGDVENRVTLTARGETNGIEIPPNTWHATVCHSPVVFMEVKQGPYEVTDDKGFASWSPEEGNDQVPNFLASLKKAAVGDSVAF